TVEGLLAYGEALATLNRAEGAPAAPMLRPATNRVQRVREVMPLIQAFAQNAQSGCPAAQAYTAARQALLQGACEGDELVFYADWNKLVAEGELTALYRAPIG